MSSFSFTTVLCRRSGQLDLVGRMIANNLPFTNCFFFPEIHANEGCVLCSLEIMLTHIRVYVEIQKGNNCKSILTLALLQSSKAWPSFEIIEIA